jgi:hypothetical protein
VDLVEPPGRILELQGQREVGRPCGKQRAQPFDIDRHPLRDPEQHGPQPLPERPQRTREPGEPGARIAGHRRQRAAALGLDREPEIGRRGVEPAGDGGGTRLPVERVVELHRRQARRVVA